MKLSVNRKKIERALLGLAGGVAVLSGMMYSGMDSRLFTDVVNAEERFVHTEGLIGEPQILNPLFLDTPISNFSQVDKDISQLLFNSLLTFDESMNLTPDLASEMPVIEKNRITFKLKQNVFWGESKLNKLTSADVKFTFNTFKSTDFPSEVKKYIWDGVEIETPDEYTIIFTIPNYSEEFLFNFTQKIAPAFVFEGMSIQEIQVDPFNSSPVGTGPYILQDRTFDSLTLRPNINYFDKKADSALRFIFFSSLDQAEEALSEGEIDFLAGSRSGKEIETAVKQVLYFNLESVELQVRKLILSEMSRSFNGKNKEFLYPEFGTDQLKDMAFDPEIQAFTKVNVLALDNSYSKELVDRIKTVLDQKVYIDPTFLKSPALFEKLSNRDFSLLIIPLRYTRIDPYPFFHNSFSGSNNGFNYSSISSKDLDILIEDFRMGKEERSAVINKVKEFYSFFEIEDTKFYYETELRTPVKIYAPEYRFLLYWK